MDSASLQLELRNALDLADELGRHEHALGEQAVAGRLAALRSTLAELERVVGRSHAAPRVPNPTLIDEARRSVTFFAGAPRAFPDRLRARLEALVASSDRVLFALERPSEPAPSKPLVRVLPLARLVPQDVHSALDHLAAAACLASALVARGSRARVAGVAFALTGTAVALATDDRGGVVKAIPIELHEAIDHAWGVSVALAPFVLGYARKEPLASALQIGAGLGMILASLLTDYRAARGRTWPIRSRGGPDALRNRRPGTSGTAVLSTPRP